MDSDRKSIATDQAARWFVVLRGPNADRERAGFEKWLGASELNRVAFDEVCAVFEGAEILRSSAKHRDRTSRRQGPPVRFWVPAALAASVALALVADVFWPPIRTRQQTAPQIRGATFATSHGAMRTVQLAQGASLALDSASEVRLENEGAVPVITLAKGRAQLRLSDSTPAFVVRVGDSEITSRHGIFDVSWIDGDEPQVQLYEGQAKVRPFMQSTAYVVSGDALPIGRAMRLARGRMETLPPRYAADERDWPQGWAQYRSVPLSELARTANRYAAKPIIFGDPALGDLHISGRFRIVDSSAVARNMANVFALTVTERPDGIYIKRP